MDELKAILLRLDALRREREKKIAQAEAIEEHCLSVGVSHVFDDIGASHQRSRHSPQERMAEAVDLRKEAYNDYITISDTGYLLEDELKALIKDYDTRLVIEYRYLYGYSMEEISEIFSEHDPHYPYEIIDRFFRYN